MENMIKMENHEISIIDSLAIECQYYRDSLANNLLEIGRVLIEAKKHVKHGEWQAWVEENSGLELRVAQSVMAAYRRFCGKNMESIDKSKLFKMLALPEGTEDKFIEENNISEMTARQVAEAVRKVRDEMQGKVDIAEDKARKAEDDLNALRTAKPAPDPEMVEKIHYYEGKVEELRANLERQAQAAQDAINTANELRKNDSNKVLKDEIAKLQVRLDAANRDLEATEEERDSYKSQLISAKSDKAKGDAERNISERLGGDEFMQAVRAFMGTCAIIPHMGRTFAAMSDDEHAIFATGIQTIKEWIKTAEKAVSSVKGEIIGE